MKKIKLVSLLLGVSILFNACSTDELTEKKKSLQEKKQAIASLKAEVKTLETEIEALAPEESEKGTIVHVQTISPVNFSHSFEVNANLKAIESSLVSPEMSGQIKEIFVKEGDKVTKGQLLARLNTRVIESSMTEVKTALDLAGKMFERQQKLWDQKIGSEVEYLTAKNSKESLDAKLNTLQAQLEMAKIVSPIDGIVDKIAVEVGELAMPGMTMMQLVNLDAFYIQADVAETHLASLKTGDVVEIYFPSFPELDTKSKISRIGNIINPENRSFIAEVKLRNTQGKLKPNMLALTRFVDFSTENALVVPTSIIKSDFSGSYIYLVDTRENGVFAKKAYIKTGLTMDDQTHALEGISAGDQIIVEGYNKIVDGTKLVIL